MTRDATGNPRNPFHEVPGHFSPPRSPVIIIQFPAPVPATIPGVPPKSDYFDNYLHCFEIFYKKLRDPHNIWLFLMLILSIPCYFVISNHENHVTLLILKINSKKIFFSRKEISN